MPALLNWHFTDRYYHTNLDTVDKTSPAEMQHVGDRGGAPRRSTWRRPGATTCADLTRLIETARDARMETEKKNNATPEIIDAWRKWYVEAIESVGDRKASPEFRQSQFKLRVVEAAGRLSCSATDAAS